MWSIILGEKGLKQRWAWEYRRNWGGKARLTQRKGIWTVTWKPIISQFAWKKVEGLYYTCEKKEVKEISRQGLRNWGKGVNSEQVGQPSMKKPHINSLVSELISKYITKKKKVELELPCMDGWAMLLSEEMVYERKIWVKGMEYSLWVIGQGGPRDLQKKIGHCYCIWSPIVTIL